MDAEPLTTTLIDLASVIARSERKRILDGRFCRAFLVHDVSGRASAARTRFIHD
jgi:hypothetical protein